MSNKAVAATRGSSPYYLPGDWSNMGDGIGVPWQWNSAEYGGDSGYYNRALNTGTAMNKDWWFCWKPDQIGYDLDTSEFVPMLFLPFTRNASEQRDWDNAVDLSTYIDDPLQMFLIGNEPELAGGRPGEDHVRPLDFIDGMYNWLDDCYTANSYYPAIAVPGVQWTPLGRSWLEQFFALLLPYWTAQGFGSQFNLHLHLYWARTAAQQVKQIGDMIDWLDTQWATLSLGVDYQLIISETCAVELPLDIQKDVMDGMYTALSTYSKLVGFAWYSTNSTNNGYYPAGNLMEDTILGTDKPNPSPLGTYWNTK